jgi:hypothetical protein
VIFMFIHCIEQYAVRSVTAVAMEDSDGINHERRTVTMLHHQSSIINHQSSIINHQSSIIIIIIIIIVDLKHRLNNTILWIDLPPHHRPSNTMSPSSLLHSISSSSYLTAAGVTADGLIAQELEDEMKRRTTTMKLTNKHSKMNRHG